MDDSTLRERAPSWPLVLFIGTAGLTVIGCSPNESKLPDRASEYVSVVTHVESESVKEDVWLANSRHEWDPRERLPWNGKPGPLLPGCSLTFLRRRVEIDLVNGSSSFALMRTFNPPNETAFSSQEELLLHLAETLDSFDTLCVYGGVWSGLAERTLDKLKELCSEHEKQVVAIACVSISHDGEYTYAMLETRRRIPLLDD